MYSFVLLAVLAAGQMTLVEIETEALANNPEIQSAVQQVRIAQARIGSAAAADDPEFAYRSWGTPILQPWNVNQTQHMFMFTQKMPVRGKRELQYLIASDDREIQALGVEAKKREISGMVRQAFYRLLRAYDQIRIHHDEVALAEETVSATRIAYTAGKAPQQDVLRAGLAYSRLAEHQIMLERDADSARAELNTLMGRAPDEPLEVTGTYGIVDRLPPFAELQQLAIENRPELQALELIEKREKRKVELAEKSLKPQLSVSAGYMLMPSGSPHRNGVIGEVSMTLPWLNRDKHDSEILQAQEETMAVRAEYQKQRATILREIRDASIRAESARKIVELYRDTLRPTAVGVSRAATVSYQTNQSGLLNVLDTQAASIEIEYALFGALAEYEQSLSELERAVGAPIPGERRPL